MTLTTAALNVLAVMQSGVLENAGQPIAELDALLKTPLPANDLRMAKSILDDARKAAYAHRFNIIRALQQLERTNLYTDATSRERASWEFSA